MTRIGLSVISLALSLSGGAAAADVVAVVSSKSAVAALSRDQVAEIFLGKTSRFPDGTAAVPIDLTEGAAERDEFYKKVASKTSAQIKAYWSKIIFTGRGQPPKIVSNGIEMKKYIAANPATIGYLDSKLVDDSVRVLR